MKQIGAYVTDSLHLRFKLACVRTSKRMTDVLRLLILEWVEEQETGEGQAEEVKDG